MSEAGDGFLRHDEDLEQRKARLIDEAVTGRPNAADVEPFLVRYFLHVPADDVLEWPPVELYEVAYGHRDFAQVRPPGVPKVRVVSFSSEELAGRAAHTLVEVVTDDMPFLVDSVSQELSRRDIAIHLVVHPQFVVRRDLAGNLLDVLGTLDAHEAPANALVESWMHFEVAPQDGADAEEALRQAILTVLRDVRDAVEDWPRMRSTADAVADELEANPPGPIETGETTEVAAFLRWLADDHFTFLGYREYRVVEDPEVGAALAVVPGSGLGILRGDKPRPRPLASLPEAVVARLDAPELLLVTKANSRATVHRPVYLDYIGVKVFDPDGVVVGERRFLGLFTSSSYVASVLDVPIVRRKAQAVIERSGFAPQSHSGKDLLRILEEHPRDEMFQTSVPELYATVIGVLHLQERRRLRLFMRRDVYGRFVSCLVFLPRERYSTYVRLRMQEILLEELHGTSIDDTLRVADSVLARVHFVVRGDDGAPVDVDRDALERRLLAATRTWDDDFADAFETTFGPDAEKALADRYTGAFPEAYKEDFSAAHAIADMQTLERLTGDDDLGLSVYEPAGAAPGETRLKVYRLGPPVSLSYVMPLLQSMGVEVSDERPYGIERRSGGHAWIYDFGLRGAAEGGDGESTDVEGAGDAAASATVLHRRFAEAFSAMWRGLADVDGFQALVLRAGLHWRDVMVLRAYAKFLRQAGSRFSQEYMESTLTANAGVARALVSLFRARLDPAFDGDRAVAQQRIVAEIERALDAVASLDQDRILRSFVGLVTATLRTNYWQCEDDGSPKPYLSLKFASESIADLPSPRPAFEVFVYSPRMEGVHLRFGPVARGGIRYSDRREDFRTEVLGLAKTQTVKNAVIVPVGSKGGFVVKRMPSDADRETQQAEVVACYRTLIRGLLDLTDNLVVDQSGRRAAVAPRDTVRHDGDDSYLVVAADKGTATFSDIANGIAAEYGFWLGDAFASGGSAGYDHKAMGITARGAWESVRRHFRVLGVNPQSTDFTCVGIGDMSGDVFGNGMLLSRHIKLIAAFDHRHVFVDPSPDAEVSFAERARLFALPRSSWADYDASLVSAGGGVWPRTAKSIPVSPQMAEVLGIDEGVTALAPSDLMRAILRAPVDLLWNGGIGTYVKSYLQSNADVGDRANDAIRVDGRDLRCRVVGEGGNLGFTQLGRIEFALGGGLVNTDAIDNSAGVDTSDHEVNIKILLDAAIRAGRLAAPDREPLLAAMTDDVAAAVLRDNYAQNVALVCSVAQAPAMVHLHAAYTDALERSGHFHRALEFLPDAEGFAQRRANGEGLTRPELAVLLAYAKITLTQELVAGDVPDAAFASSASISYFPPLLRERFADEIREHPLRRDIVATQLANELVNYSGLTFASRIMADTAASASDIVRAHTTARTVFATDAAWHEVELLDDVVANDVQVTLLLAIRQVLERATRWFMSNRRSPIDVLQLVSVFAGPVGKVLGGVPSSLRGAEAQRFEADADALLASGVPVEAAHRVLRLREASNALAIVDIAGRANVDVDEVAAVHFGLADVMQFARLATLIGALPRDTRWRSLARAAARDDLLAAHAELTFDVLSATPSGHPAQERVAAWQQENAAAIDRARAVIEDSLRGDTADLATLSVALREVRGLVRAAVAARE
jgi:glutamate dehydrogenase